MKNITNSLNNDLKAKYKGQIFRGLENDSHLNNDANYQSILNHFISDVELTLSYKQCYYEGDTPEIVLNLSFNIPNKNRKIQKTSFEIGLDTKFMVDYSE